MDKLEVGDPIRDKLVSFLSWLRVYSTDFLENQFNTREIAPISFFSMVRLKSKSSLELLNSSPIGEIFSLIVDCHIYLVVTG